MPKGKREIFTRGYKPIRDRILKCTRFVRSCFNCKYYYQMVGDETEVCQNDNVLEYDMVYEPGMIYCLWWKPSFEKGEEKMFKSRRSVLD